MSTAGTAFGRLRARADADAAARRADLRRRVLAVVEVLVAEDLPMLPMRDLAGMLGVAGTSVSDALAQLGVDGQVRRVRGPRRTQRLVLAGGPLAGRGTRLSSEWPGFPALTAEQRAALRAASEASG